MKRDFFSIARMGLSVVFTCLIVAISIQILRMPSAAPAWAALHNPPTTPYHNVIVVAKSGGDFISVQKALNSITDNSPSNHYLVWIAPGIYTETVTMKPYVDIEGAGEMATRIVSSDGAPLYSPTLTGASNAELRYLTVENYSPVFATAILNTNASPSLLHVTAISSQRTGEASGGTPGSSPVIWTSYGIRNTSGSSPIMTDVTISNAVAPSALGYGMYNDSSSPTMKDVTISISGGAVGNSGVYNSNSSSTMKDVTIISTGGTANYGVYNANNSTSTMKDVTVTASETGVGNYGSSMTMDDSTVSASYRTISSNQSSRVGASRLQGGPVEGPVTCAGVYDENYTFFPNTCP